MLAKARVVANAPKLYHCFYHGAYYFPESDLCEHRYCQSFLKEASK
jgi:hypothetical protein